MLCTYPWLADKEVNNECLCVLLGTRGAFPGGGEGARADDRRGGEEAGRVAPRHGAEEAVRDMEAAGHVDGRRERGRRRGRRRRVLRAARHVHGAGHTAQEQARGRVPHHHQAPERLLAPGLTEWSEKGVFIYKQ